MEYYSEYPIRCQSCFEQIACYAEEYQQLLRSGLTTEEALNTMGIINICSRIAMMNPVTVPYNMENRTAIEGIKPVNLATAEDDIAYEKTRRDPVFSQCISPNMMIPVQTSTAPASNKPISLMSLMTRPSASKVVPVIKDIAPKEVKEEGISVQLPKKSEEFKFPTMVGVPVINNNPQFPDVTSVVGPKMKTYILTGRTYIAK